jgi:hypothetical protein
MAAIRLQSQRDVALRPAASKHPLPPSFRKVDDFEARAPLRKQRTAIQDHAKLAYASCRNERTKGGALIPPQGP